MARPTPPHEDDAAWAAALADRYWRAALHSIALEQRNFWLQVYRRRRGRPRAEALANALAWMRVAALFR